MKRSPALQPLSRQHHTALVLARACEQAAKANDAELLHQTCQRVLNMFDAELAPHFKIEEEQLLPLLQDPATITLRVRTLADHQHLREMLPSIADNDGQTLARFGTCLYDHVRFEERQLFPVLELILAQCKTIQHPS